MKSTQTVSAISETSETIPSKQYKNLNLVFKTTPKDLNIIVRTKKKENLKFQLTAGSRKYIVNAQLDKYSFKKKTKHQVDVKITSTEFKRKSTLYKGEFFKTKSKNKKYVYIFC
ncbi:exosortase XrtG N-terminal extension domain-like protein [Lactobacillus acidophilus]|uniref:exosortase XrtG N-terminal extension domain-like protein n=1 Tax=Lactobacillus acidophilus TaxID=1579 RepID=UPI0021A41C7F|nr:exosortase XrtG N-terminal extension domain-like protein [Lactobacillus acidophilus]